MIAEYADEIIKTHSEEYKDNPLFLYLPFQDVHSPLEVPDEYLDLYPNEKNRARQKFSGSKKNSSSIICLFFLSYIYLFFHSKGFCIRCFNCKNCDVIKRKWIIWKFFNCLHCGCKYNLGWRCFLTFFSNLFTFQNGGQPISGGNNYPLRGIKSTIWEGGTRAASFVHAPYVLQRHGEISNKYIL